MVLVNEAIEKKNSVQLTEKLNNAGLKLVEGSLCDRYLARLITAKQKKYQVGLRSFAFVQLKQLSADLFM